MRFATNSDDGARIGYDLVGEGAPLLFFHGSLTSSALWRTLGYVDALRVTRQLILVDARGHGHSDKPTTMEAYAMERLVGDVIAVLDDCEVPETAYLGYSMGGRVGFGLGIRAPERVRALILGGASHRPQALWTRSRPRGLSRSWRNGASGSDVRSIRLYERSSSATTPARSFPTSDGSIASPVSTTSSSRVFSVPYCCSPESTTTSGSQILELRRPSFPTPNSS
jgi:pimeloyl-ACP methyl ester carboxylesterase